MKLKVVELHDDDLICVMVANFHHQPDDWGKLLAHSIGNKMDLKVSIGLAKAAVAAGSHSKLIDYVAAYELTDLEKFNSDMFDNIIWPEFISNAKVESAKGYDDGKKN